MKALILAAGLGTRLRPYTDHRPKPLFPVGGQTLLDRLICQLKAAGCEAIAVNTHYLHEKIDSHIAARSYGIPVFTRYEPEILGTGGAIRNLSHFWDDRPFLVVNADILTDIDFGAVYRHHGRTGAPATLVLMDSPPLNSVTVDRDRFVSGFLPQSDRSGKRSYTFTGIQVMEPHVLQLIPDQGFYSSIDAYRQLIAKDTPPAAHITGTDTWQDLGTPERYSAACRDATAAEAHRHAFGCRPEPCRWQLLAGDGSDRRWYRLRSGQGSLVAADHGLKPAAGPSEVDAFAAIGRHLFRCGLPVPEIYACDLFSGWVVMADVGDRHLQAAVADAINPETVTRHYQAVLDILIRFSQDGMAGFDTAWTCQSAAYDRSLILSRECAYFLEAFVTGYLGLRIDPDALAPSFRVLADGALTGALTGLMHRDFQSRNIMVFEGRPHVIDFQGARLGPVQYDLASLLIDPYTGLSPSLQESLYDYAVAGLSQRTAFDPGAFRRCYEFCRITRNLQMLGAFGFLTRVKQKPHFERYIPAALDTLKRNLALLAHPGVSRLRELLEEIRLDPL